MTEEFQIFFQYRSHPYDAHVLKSTVAGRTDYAVRPVAVFLVREYGKQTLIFKENGVFQCSSELSLHNPDYIRTLIHAIQDQDHSTRDASFAKR